MHRHSLGSRRYEVTFTHNPDDVAGSSTDKGWISCLNTKHGIYKDSVAHDISNGSVIAYLHNPGETDMSNPSGKLP